MSKLPIYCYAYCVWWVEPIWTECNVCKNYFFSLDCEQEKDAKEAAAAAAKKAYEANFHNCPEEMQAAQELAAAAAAAVAKSRKVISLRFHDIIMTSCYFVSGFLMLVKSFTSFAFVLQNFLILIDCLTWFTFSLHLNVVFGNWP